MENLIYECNLRNDLLPNDGGGVFSTTKKLVYQCGYIHSCNVQIMVLSWLLHTAINDRYTLSSSIFSSYYHRYALDKIDAQYVGIVVQ